MNTRLNPNPTSNIEHTQAAQAALTVAFEELVAAQPHTETLRHQRAWALKEITTALGSVEAILKTMRTPTIQRINKDVHTSEVCK